MDVTKPSRHIAHFYPRSPCGERLHAACPFCDNYYFYPRSPCGERRALGLLGWLRVLISIHALLAESDREPTALRTPHHKFLSTLSLRRATPGARHANSQQEFLSTLSLRRATTRYLINARYTSISIHALLAESDLSGPLMLRLKELFLSTLSLRRATGFIAGRQLPATFLSTLSLRRATRCK